MLQIGIKQYGASHWPAYLSSIPGARVHRLSPREALHPSLDVCMHVVAEDTASLDEAVSSMISADPCLHWVIDQGADTLRGQWVIKAGASGYTAMPSASAECVRVIARLKAGEYWVPRQVLTLLVRDLVDEPSIPLAIRLKLSPRERQVADCVASGYSNKRIARVLEVTERTVKAHLSNIFQKTPASDRLELALLMKGELPEGVRIDL